MARNNQTMDNRRSMRLLMMLMKQSAILEPSADETICFLHFEGSRRVKCNKVIIANWIARELVSITITSNIQKISVTELGRKHVSRNDQADFGAQHRQIETDHVKIDDCLQSVQRNIKESPLSGLYRAYGAGKKTWLNSAEFDAGERLRVDFEYAQLGPKISASWDPTAHLSNSKGGRRPTQTYSDRAISARSRMQRAIDAVGPELSGVLLDVCCFLKGMEEVERERQWPRRSAKLMLKAALSILARHYNPQETRLRPAKSRHWGQADYRPEM